MKVNTWAYNLKIGRDVFLTNGLEIYKPLPHLKNKKYRFNICLGEIYGEVAIFL